jgi:AraC-like DNA-binding protein
MLDGDVVPPVATLRVSAAWGLPDLLKTLGVELETVLADAGLPEDQFTSRENLFTCAQLVRLFRACEERSGCDYIGLLVGQRSRLADMGLAGRAAMCEPTGGKALRSFIDHYNLHDTAATLTLVSSPGFSELIYTVSARGLSDTRHFQLTAITSTFNILQDLFGPDWLPVEVAIASRSPSSLRPFQKFFRAPVQFDCDRSAIVFSNKWLDRPMGPVDDDVRRAVATDVRSGWAEMLVDFPASMRRILRKQLLLGKFSMPEVAKLLSMHRRTLDRHLQVHGVAYGELVESVRDDVARQLLVDTDMPIQHVAEAVRYSTAANFATAFRRRTGVTPREYRRSLRRSTPQRDGYRYQKSPRQHEREAGKPRLGDRVLRVAIAEQEQEREQDHI